MLWFQPFLRREKYKLFVCFYEALMVKETDGSVEFEVSIGKFSSDQIKMIKPLYIPFRTLAKIEFCDFSR